MLDKFSQERNIRGNLIREYKYNGFTFKPELNDYITQKILTTKKFIDYVNNNHLPNRIVTDTDIALIKKDLILDIQKKKIIEENQMQVGYYQ